MGRPQRPLTAILSCRVPLAVANELRSRALDSAAPLSTYLEAYLRCALPDLPWGEELWPDGQAPEKAPEGEEKTGTKAS